MAHHANTISIYVVAMQCHLWRVGRRGDNLNSSFGRERMDDEESIPPEDQLWRSLAMVSPHTHPRQKRQLTQDMVRMLPTRLYGLENQEECEKAAKEQNGCVICLEPFKFGDAIRSLPCLHEYHKDCIGKNRYLSLDNIRYLQFFHVQILGSLKRVRHVHCVCKWLIYRHPQRRHTLTPHHHHLML